MSVDLKITAEQYQSEVPVSILHLHGWLDNQSEDLLVQAAHGEYDKGARYLLLEMSEISTMTSAGIRALQKIYHRFTPSPEDSQEIFVKLCNAQPQIYEVLSITGLLQNIPMYESQQDALVSFKNKK